MQAISALQSFSSPRLYPPSPSVFPSSSPFPNSSSFPSSSPFSGNSIYPAPALFPTTTNTSIFPPSPSPDHLEIDLSLPITSTYLKRLKVQGDLLNMAVFFWYLVKSDLSSLRYCTLEHLTKHFLQGSRKHGHV